MSSILFALFLLSAFTSNLPSAEADLVFDIDGDPIGNGGQYFILPVIRGIGGGIGRTSTGNETCPITVVQFRSELDNGLPIIIESPFRVAFISEGLSLDLMFTFLFCGQTPSKFTVVNALSNSQGWFVKLTGYANTVQGWFKIEKHFRDYKLVFCTLSGDTCKDIGIQIDEDGNRLLVLTEEYPLILQFKKVSTSSA